MRIKNVVIIGAGVSGLSAAIYAEQHGFHATILEKNPVPGGLCTGWYRKNYYLDGCIHWLTGTKKGCELYTMWKNVHAFEDEYIIHLPSFGTFEYEGIKVPFYRDLDKAEKAWLEISPEDKKMIYKFFDKVRDFMTISSPVQTPANKMGVFKLIKYGLKVLSVFPSYLLSMKQNAKDFAKKFKHPALRYAISQIQPGRGNFFQLLYSYSSIASGNGGVPTGGSVAMVNNMVDYFLSIGGTIKYNYSVEDVVVKNKEVTAVKLKNGQVVECDYLVPACDSYYFLNNILKGKYTKNRFVKKLMDERMNPTPSSTLVYFLFKKDLGIDYIYDFQCEPYHCGRQTYSSIVLRNYSYDKTICSKDNSVISVLVNQFQEDYDYWNSLFQSDKALYRKEKQRIVDDLMTRIVKQFPELEGNIEVLDVNTPVTLKRYTNSYKGAYMPFAFTSKNSMYWDNGRIKGLKNTFMASQWMASPGGLPFALATGTWAVQRICKRESIKYLLGDKPSLKLAKK